MELSLKDPVWISRTDDLLRFLSDVQKYKFLGVDTESNGLHAYREQVCLIQFSTENCDYLLDPIALKNLSPLAGVFADPKIEKVFHAAEYDLICLKRDYGFHFVNLFDTMLAGRILGRNATGLGGMLELEFGISVDKHCQRANWGRRPLPPNMVTYAQMDSHYLIQLRHRLREELINKGRLHLAEEDFERLCHTQVTRHDNGEDGYWRVAGGHSITPSQAAVLQQVFLYREKIGKNTDQPVFKVLSNQTLLQVAKTCPQKISDLEQVCQLTPRQISLHGQGLLEAVSRGLSSKPVKRPAAHRQDEEFLSRLEALRFWRKDLARQTGVESDVILPREILEKIAYHNPRDLEELRTLMEGTPWRFEQYGQRIFKALN